MTRNLMNRGVGLVVIGIALAVGALVWIGLALSSPTLREAPDSRLLFGIWRIFYANQAPAVGVILAAIAIALLAGAIVAIVEGVIATRYRRSLQPETLPLAPRPVMDDTRGVFHGEVTVTVLIPAHNEQERIADTLASLRAQQSPPERIIVVADNCTDRTVELARAAGVEVIETVANQHKKAGGLNQALARVLPDQGENDAVMIMDADTVLVPGYLAEAKRRMTADRALMAVGGLFFGEPGSGWIGQYQRNEFTRYSREIQRRRGRVYVLTGTASVFRPRALRTVAASRGSLLPGRSGDVYDTAALTEDNELTIALKSLGALMISPAECGVVTEVMPTYRALWAQRLRWQRGALENIGAYGLTPQTFRYWAQQFGLGYGVVALFSYFALMALMLVSMDTFVWFPFWVLVGLLFSVERTVTAWRGGWRARLVAVLVFPELWYSAFLNTVFLKGICDIALGRKATWQHVHRTDDGRVSVVGGDHS
ncbi:glycosyltransferase family 2 protein [Aestuariimicrobium soli]|uniref:glycosyltransferase family 2 protein n=1 Tax=Aestuariimicrobium soli TaxID=2035834 RepID=UPI003EB91BC8